MAGIGVGPFFGHSAAVQNPAHAIMPVERVPHIHVPGAEPEIEQMVGRVLGALGGYRPRNLGNRRYGGEGQEVDGDQTRASGSSVLHGVRSSAQTAFRACNAAGGSALARMTMSYPAGRLWAIQVLTPGDPPP